jgi:hypothetical protein
MQTFFLNVKHFYSNTGNANIRYGLNCRRAPLSLYTDDMIQFVGASLPFIITPLCEGYTAINELSARARVH